MSIDEQVHEFAALGEVFDPNRATDQAVAVELADVLTAKVVGGPIAKVNALNRVLRIMRLAVRLVVARRDHEVYAMGAYWSHKRIAEYVDHVSVPTVQKWAQAGRKAVGAPDVSRETGEAQLPLPGRQLEEIIPSPTG